MNGRPSLRRLPYRVAGSAAAARPAGDPAPGYLPPPMLRRTRVRKCQVAPSRRRRSRGSREIASDFPYMSIWPSGSQL